jgi:hypothetical protein
MLLTVTCIGWDWGCLLTQKLRLADSAGCRARLSFFTGIPWAPCCGQLACLLLGAFTHLRGVLATRSI